MKITLPGHKPNCACPFCVVANGPGTPYYEQALSYTTRPLPLLTREGFDEIARRAAEQRERQDWGNLNAYVCPVCKVRLVTIDRDPGVTPAFLDCEREEHQSGKLPLMTSAFYRLSGFTDADATKEFYRPTFEDYLLIRDLNCVNHLNAGGLLLRSVGAVYPDGWEYMTGRPPIKIFCLDDTDWFAALTLDEAKDSAVNNFGRERDEVDAGDWYEMTGDEMDRFVYSYDEDPPRKATFRERLREMITDGERFPEFFASTEY